MKKTLTGRIIALVLAVLMTVSFGPTDSIKALAAETDTVEASEETIYEDDNLSEENFTDESTEVNESVSEDEEKSEDTETAADNDADEEGESAKDVKDEDESYSDEETEVTDESDSEEETEVTDESEFVEEEEDDEAASEDVQIEDSDEAEAEEETENEEATENFEEEGVSEDIVEEVFEESVVGVPVGVATSGKSNNVSWSFDEETETLTISGTGDWEHKSSEYNPWFALLTYVKSAKVNLKGATNLSGMFENCLNMTSVDLSGLDTSDVTDMSKMFSNCQKLKKVNLKKFNTSNVENMKSMFYMCEDLSVPDFSSFDTSKVTNMSTMFGNCANFDSIDISNFETPKLKECTTMFSGCSDLTYADVSGMTFPKGCLAQSFFYDCKKLEKMVTPKSCIAKWSLNNGILTAKWKDIGGKVYTNFPSKSKLLFISTYKFEEKTIQYILDGGTNHKDNKTVYTKKFTLKKPTKKGYIFNGWFDEKNRKVSVLYDRNVTLTAHWTPITYTVTFVDKSKSFYRISDGKKVSSVKVKVTYEGEFTAFQDYKANPREGYEFMGFSRRSDGKGTVYFIPEEFSRLTTKNKASIKLYAVWLPNPYTVTFDINSNGASNSDLGGIDVMQAKKVDTKYGKTFKLPKNSFTRKGYRFLGWSKEKNGTVNYKNNAKVKNLCTGGEITLYAVWAVNTYSVKYSLNGGKGTVPPTAKGLQYRITDKRLQVPDGTGLTKKGYVFAGWNTKKDGSGQTFTTADGKTDIAAKNGQVITLYAVWKKQ